MLISSIFFIRRSVNFMIIFLKIFQKILIVLLFSDHNIKITKSLTISLCKPCCAPIRNLVDRKFVLCVTAAADRMIYSKLVWLGLNYGTKLQRWFLETTVARQLSKMDYSSYTILDKELECLSNGVDVSSSTLRRRELMQLKRRKRRICMTDFS